MSRRKGASSKQNEQKRFSKESRAVPAPGASAELVTSIQYDHRRPVCDVEFTRVAPLTESSRKSCSVITASPFIASPVDNHPSSFPPLSWSVTSTRRHNSASLNWNASTSSDDTSTPSKGSAHALRLKPHHIPSPPDRNLQPPPLPCTIVLPPTSHHNSSTTCTIPHLLSTKIFSIEDVVSATPPSLLQTSTTIFSAPPIGCRYSSTVDTISSPQTTINLRRIPTHLISM
ncbi:hypothetical protein Bca4012_068348 [Brassica carinata]|uniref:Uncharacterized protein n=1 Tax=Brassica carinata TaxID=52824 RepID=A0A8X7VV50_BRACI|nr:hypothetical protein Bca52824_020580 [Brassica carinata]